MKKNKKTIKERLKKANNPLKHISNRDLLITLLSILICVLIGFGCGYGCAKSCKSVSASAYEFTILGPDHVPAAPDQGSNGSQYVFNMYLGNDLYTCNFLIYKSYTPDYLLNSHWLALADDNSYTPREYVEAQLYQHTSEEEYYGLEILPTAVDVEYELYYTFYNDENTPVYSYNEETLYETYTTISYSNLAEGGFNDKLAYFFTCNKGFGVVLENGSYWAVDMRSEVYGNMHDLIALGMGNIYTYEDIFLPYSNSDNNYNDGYLVGYDQGYDQGYDVGYNSGYIEGIQSEFGDVTPWQHIVNGVNSFLSIEIFPNVRISLILSIGFGVVLLGFGIKIFLGG